ncbi:MAG: acyloxyacyl hydrolase [Flavobacterium sp.]
MVFCCATVFAQESGSISRWSVGLGYGFGREFKQRNYTYDNSYVQAQVYYTLNPGKKWQYQFALMPEVNFASHKLQNLYFVTPDDPDYEYNRYVYTQQKDIREYILNVAFFIRRNINEDFSMYAMFNVGPMITDTETERLSKGFAFCDVFAIGASYDFGGVLLDIRPNVRHVSNGGLQDSNAGFNSYNFTFGVIVPL